MDYPHGSTMSSSKYDNITITSWTKSGSTMSSTKYDNITMSSISQYLQLSMTISYLPQCPHERNAVLRRIMYFLAEMTLTGEFVMYDALKYIIFSLLCFILLLK